MDQFAVRRYIVGGFVIIIAVIYVIRLFFLQVIDSSYKSSAESNTRKYVTQYPARGLIYDRNNKLLVYNQPAYDLMVSPYLLSTFDTTEIVDILNISKTEVKERLKAAREYSYYKPSIFIKQISSETYAVLQEKLFKYPGFFVQTRTLREYSENIAAHVLGYVGEVDKDKVKNDDYYSMGDHIGISGIEKTYEEVLRGSKGVKIYLVDVHNRIKGSYLNGKQDINPTVGSNVQITIDAGLQKYGEKLMENKRGSIVAIEPSSGEILTLVSTPTYNPDLLVGRVRTKNYKKLTLDTLKPLFNRALMAKYPPGSTFKLINALVGLQEMIISPHTLYSCRGAYRAGHVIVKCHNYRSPLTVIGAIQYSSNNFFCRLFRNTLDHPKFEGMENGFTTWRDHVTSFGFGSKLKTDFTNELSGYIPTIDYYNRYYGENGWKSLTIVSLAIGQGEIGITPVQLANMAATIANRGYYYIPHIVKNIEGKEMVKRFVEKNYTSIDSNHFEIVIDGMEKVVNGGAGSTGRIARLNDITVCGKTGTAENPHGDDHSIFVAFAPENDPQIAVSVYVENGGFGSRWAAPIASLVIEKYLKGDIKRKWLENRMLNADLINIEKKD